MNPAEYLHAQLYAHVRLHINATLLRQSSGSIDVKRIRASLSADQCQKLEVVAVHLLEIHSSSSQVDNGDKEWVNLDAAVVAIEMVNLSVQDQ